MGSTLIPNLIRGKKIYPNDTRSQIPIRHYLDGSVIGHMPDIGQRRLNQSIGSAKRGYEALRQIGINTLLEIIERAGVRIYGDDSLDQLMAMSRGNTISHVEGSRRWTGTIMYNAKRLLGEMYPQVFLENDEIIGKGPSVVTASATSPAAQMVAILGPLLQGNPVIVRANSLDPGSAALLMTTIMDGLGGLEGCEQALNLLTYDRHSAGKEGWGTSLYQSLGRLVYMGNSERLKQLTYGREDVVGLPIPGGVHTYIGHGSVILTGSDCTEATLDGIVREATDCIYACFRPPVVMTTDPYLEGGLRDRFKELRVGNVLDPETEVPLVSEDYWRRHVDGGIRIASGDSGRLILGGELNRPTLVKSPSEASIIQEVPWAYLGIYTDPTIEMSLGRMNRAAENLPKCMWLRLYYDGIDPQLMRGVRAFTKLGLEPDDNFPYFEGRLFPDLANVVPDFKRSPRGLELIEGGPCQMILPDKVLEATD